MNDIHLLRIIIVLLVLLLFQNGCEFTRIEKLLKRISRGERIPDDD